ncbi:MAG: hypothetical protein ACLSAH_11760 [Bilophila wadsworthia]
MVQALRSASIALCGDVIDFSAVLVPTPLDSPATRSKGMSSGLIASRTNATTSLTCTASA